MYTQLVAVLGASILGFSAPPLAQNDITAYPNNGICASGSLMLLKCCSPTTYTTCETTNATCRAVPFNGVCVQATNKLAIRFPADYRSFDYLNSQGIFLTDLVNMTESGNPVGPIEHQEAQLLKVRREARASIALTARGARGSTQIKTAGKKAAATGKGKVKELGLAGANSYSDDQPPQPCQIVGNVVFSSCDYENALLDHFMGDHPCDYGC